MGEALVEIEHRFFIPDPAILPPLGKGVGIVQCYLPRIKLEMVEGAIYFGTRQLVRKWSLGDVSGVSVTDNQAKEIEKLMEPDNFQIESFRIRIADQRAYVTIKGPGYLQRFEGEWEVRVDEVEDLVSSMRFDSVRKKRFRVPCNDGLFWEIDFFEGDDCGLVMAEIEVPSVDYHFEKPPWLGRNVTQEKRFGNGSLAKYESWCDLKEDRVLMRWLMGPN